MLDIGPSLSVGIIVLQGLVGHSSLADNTASQTVSTLYVKSLAEAAWERAFHRRQDASRLADLEASATQHDFSFVCTTLSVPGEI